MHRMRLSLLVLVVVAIAGCSRPVDTAAEEQAIRRLDRLWVHTVVARDTVTISDFYADDAEFLPSNAPRVTGRAAIREAWSQLLRVPRVLLTFAPTKVWVAGAGDLAYETGAYHLAYDGPKGKRVEDTGKFVVAWRKVDGVWKVQYDIFNSDKPAAS